MVINSYRRSKSMGPTRTLTGAIFIVKLIMKGWGCNDWWSRPCIWCMRHPVAMFKTRNYIGKVSMLIPRSSGIVRVHRPTAIRQTYVALARRTIFLIVTITPRYSSHALFPGPEQCLHVTQVPMPAIPNFIDL